MSTKDVEPMLMRQVKYQGKSFEVKNTWIRWLTHKNLGGEEYQHNHALRHFTVGPKGEVPIHSHKQTHVWYMLSGKVIAISVTKNGAVEEKQIGPGDFVYNYSFEPHGLKNLSASEPAVFLCCIDCIDEEQNCVPSA